VPSIVEYCQVLIPRKMMVVNESMQQHESFSKQPSLIDTTPETISSSSSIKPSTMSTPKSNHFASYATTILSIHKYDDILEELFRTDAVTDHYQPPPHRLLNRLMLLSQRTKMQ